MFSGLKLQSVTRPVSVASPLNNITLVFITGLNWGVPPGGGYEGQGGLLFFVGAFGG